MNNTFLFQAMALDLKRVALAYHSNSLKTAERFMEEVRKRRAEINVDELSQPALKTLHIVDSLWNDDNITSRADNALMVSTLLLSFSK